MGKINNLNLYPLDRNISVEDFFLGSDAENNFSTVNFSMGDLVTFVADNLPSIMFNYIISATEIPPSGEIYINSPESTFETATSFNINMTTEGGVNLSNLFNLINANRESVYIRIQRETESIDLGYYKILDATQTNDYFIFSVETYQQLFSGGFEAGDNVEIIFEVQIQHNFDDILNTPTTVGGYGILDTPRSAVFDTSSSLLNFINSSGNTQFSVSLQSLASGSVTIRYNAMTEMIELVDGEGNVTSSFPASALLTGVGAEIDFDPSDSTMLRLLTETGTVLSTVAITTNSIGGLDTYTGFDTRYYTESEIDDFFFGTTPINGYNNTNWDNAFSWGDHSLVGYLTEIPSDVLREGDDRIDFDFGLTTQNVNQIITRSTYRPASNAIGLPIAAVGYLKTEGDNFFGYQTFHSQNDIYFRTRSQNYRAWERLARASEIPTSLPANGGDSDTVGGISATQFVRNDVSDDQDIIGDLNIVKTNPDLLLRDGVDRLSIRLVGGNATFTQTNGNFRFLSLSGDSVSNFTVEFGGFDRDIWHEGNDGAGSGLDADLLDGEQGSFYRDYNNLTSTPDLTVYQLTSEKGQIDGYAGLDGNGQVPLDQLPQAALGGLQFQGEWNAATNTPPIPDSAEENRGHYYIVSVAGNTIIDGVGDWDVGDIIASNGISWFKINNTDSVTSVNGRLGAVVITADDIGIANDSARLGNQLPSFYLDYNNFANTPDPIETLFFLRMDTFFRQSINSDLQINGNAAFIFGGDSTGRIETTSEGFIFQNTVGVLFQGFSGNDIGSFRVRSGGALRDILHTGNFNISTVARTDQSNSFTGFQRINGDVPQLELRNSFNGSLSSLFDSGQSFNLRSGNGNITLESQGGGNAANVWVRQNNILNTVLHTGNLSQNNIPLLNQRNTFTDLLNVTRSIFSGITFNDTTTNTNANILLTANQLRIQHSGSGNVIFAGESLTNLQGDVFILKNNRSNRVIHDGILDDFNIARENQQATFGTSVTVSGGTNVQLELRETSQNTRSLLAQINNTMYYLSQGVHVFGGQFTDRNANGLRVVHEGSQRDILHTNYSGNLFGGFQIRNVQGLRVNSGVAESDFSSTYSSQFVKIQHNGNSGSTSSYSTALTHNCHRDLYNDDRLEYIVPNRFVGGAAIEIRNTGNGTHELHFATSGNSVPNDGAKVRFSSRPILHSQNTILRVLSYNSPEQTSVTLPSNWLDFQFLHITIAVGSILEADTLDILSLLRANAGTEFRVGGGTVTLRFNASTRVLSRVQTNYTFRNVNLVH